jgi:hypothetical protein
MPWGKYPGPQLFGISEQFSKAEKHRLAIWHGKCRDFRHTAVDGKVSQAVAKAFAESEFEKYRIVQDRLFESDFDRHIKIALEGGKETE